MGSMIAECIKKYTEIAEISIGENNYYYECSECNSPNKKNKDGKEIKRKNKDENKMKNL
jgi:hypothetical protein